jgi:nucleotide-binding universal stress UspA family protein
VERIVVGVDPSETARRAAAEAADLAEVTGAALHFVTAITKGGYSVPGGRTAVDHQLTTVDRAEGLLSDLASRYRPRLREVTSAAVEGKPADVILAEAERVGADCIVVGNRRMRGVARFLGAVASDVAHRARCDVYIANTVG